MRQSQLAKSEVEEIQEKKMPGGEETPNSRSSAQITGQLPSHACMGPEDGAERRAAPKAGERIL